MLNTKKLLYILPDVAYYAELLAGKKPHTYSIQTFKQFNGDLIEGNKLQTENIIKLFGRLESGNYGVVLPDEIFTNTIVNVEKESESEVKEYLTDEVIPSLHISPESHQIETFILSEYKGSFKVQLSTAQHSILAPLKQAEEASDVQIEKIFPLSWTIKSLVSLEPSITLLQMGQNLFLAKHYIGVDQPMGDVLENIDRFVEAIKTFKGSEPSIQTVYLLSNELVEEKLKEKLSEVLPIQQLTEKTDENAKLPSYVEKAITAAMRTISIEDFEIPEFDLKQISAKAAAVGPTAKTSSSDDEDQSEAELTEQEDEKLEESKASSLPKPGDKEVISQKKVQEDEDDQKDAAVETEDLDEGQEKIKAEEVQASQAAAAGTGAASMTDSSKLLKEEAEELEEADESTDDVDLSQFTDRSNQEDEAKEGKKMPKKSKMKKKKVLKNNDGVGNFVKVFLIGLASFVVTVAIGVGIGFGVLKLSQPDSQEIESPVVEESVDEISPTPEPSPTPAPSIDKNELSIKVVNATTKAGYAGQTANQLEEAGYGQVTASNASGDYEPGLYVLLPEENQALVELLREDLDLELQTAEGYEVEDPRSEYAAVVVLAE
jgi:hypothetical protein